MAAPVYVFEDRRWIGFSDHLHAWSMRAARGCADAAGTVAEEPGPSCCGRAGAPSGLADVWPRASQDLPINPGLWREGLILVNARWLLLRTQRQGWELPDTDTAGLAQSSIVWLHLSPELAGKIDLSRLHEASTLEAILPEVRRFAATATLISRPWDLFEHQRAAIAEDLPMQARPIMEP